MRDASVMFLYKEAARVILAVEEKKVTAKNGVLQNKYKNKKQLQGLVCNVLRHHSLLKQILDVTSLTKHEKVLREPHLAAVLLWDHLFGKGIQSPGKHKDAVLRHKSALQSQLVRLTIKANVSTKEELLQTDAAPTDVLPRYVRVNTLLSTAEDVTLFFQKEGFVEVPTQATSYDKYLEQVRGLSGRQFLVDPHVPHLLVFPPGTDLHDHPLYQKGHIILQDKASCLPALALSPPEGVHVIDACAAPGNKTTHLSAMMNNKGVVVAFDKDSARASTLRTMCQRAGARCVEVHHTDFLSVQPRHYDQVEYILVDPSCSGSGMPGRQDNNSDYSAERLEKLACFQATLLKHALSFPRVRRLVYSTCSIHERENEGVVEDVSSQVEGDYRLEHILADLPHRGLGDKPWARDCVRMTPKHDLTNGFFLACFVRIKDVGNDVASDRNDDEMHDSINANHKGVLKRKAANVEQTKEISPWKSNGRKRKKRKTELVKTEAKAHSTRQASKCKQKKKRKRKHKPVT